ncbi:MAG: rod-binding protein [Gemmatimonadetes bacterium]|nr:rod-binding protein [Gemmatimonadota bacterium]
MTIPTIAPTGPVAPSADEQRLAHAVRQLEGVFVEQLFKAMRETVPTDGLTNGGAGEEMFNSLMDQHLAALVPQEWPSTFADALVERFRAAGALSTTPPQ